MECITFGKFLTFTHINKIKTYRLNHIPSTVAVEYTVSVFAETQIP